MPTLPVGSAAHQASILARISKFHTRGTLLWMLHAICSHKVDHGIFCRGRSERRNEANALAAFNDKNNEQFHVLDLYVFCINTVDGKFSAQLKSALIDTDAESFKVGRDAVGKRLLSTLRGAPEGKIISVAYDAARPGTTSATVPKVSFVARVGKQGCGVGYYR